MSTARIVEEKTGNVIEYYIEDRLKNSLDYKVIPSLHQKDKDFIICVDGKEGSGKSTLALQLGKYIDPSLTLNRIVFSPEDFRQAVLDAKKGQCIIYDEAFTGFSSRASLSPINKVLVSLAMQMRQKNLCVLIVLPTIFLLDKYMAIFRTRALVHVYESHGRRGYFKIYNYRVKKLLLLLGAKTMSYHSKGVYSNFRGRFYGKFALGDEKVEKKYRKMKEEALANSEKTSMTSAQVRYREQRDIFIYLLRKQSKMTYEQLANLMLDYDIQLSYVQVSRICAKFGDKPDVLAPEDIKRIENKQKDREDVKEIEKLGDKPIRVRKKKVKIEEKEEMVEESKENIEESIENEENGEESEDNEEIVPKIDIKDLKLDENDKKLLESEPNEDNTEDFE